MVICSRCCYIKRHLKIQWLKMTNSISSTHKSEMSAGFWGKGLAWSGLNTEGWNHLKAFLHQMSGYWSDCEFNKSCRLLPYTWSLHVVWAPLQHGFWVPRVSIPEREPSGNHIALYDLAIEVTRVTSALFYSWGSQKNLSNFNKKGNTLYLLMGLWQLSRKTYGTINTTWSWVSQVQNILFSQ